MQLYIFKGHIAIWLLCLYSMSESTTLYRDAGVNAILKGSYTSVTTINLYFTTLVTINKTLTEMIPNVQTLYFYENRSIREFSEDALESFVSLVSLRLRYTSLDKIPNLQPVKDTLTTLYIEGSLITTVATGTFAGMTKLNSLTIADSPLTNFPNLSGVQTLLTISFKETDIPAIDNSYVPPQATKFTLSDNLKLITADPIIQFMPNLEEILLDSNPMPITALFVGCQKVKKVTATNSGLTAIPDLDACVHSITELDLSHNNIAIIQPEELSGLTELRKLKLEYNPITSLPVMPDTALPKLDYLYLSYISLLPQVTPIDIKFPATRYLYLTNASLTMFPNLADAAYTVTLKKNIIRLINPSSFSETSRMSTLYLEDNELETFPPIAKLPSLSSLYLKNNPIKNITWAAANPTKLSLSRLPMTTLYLDGVILKNEEDPSLWEKLTNLQVLGMTKCQLTELPLFLKEVGNTVRYLYLDDNSLKTLDSAVFSTMTALYRVRMNRNQLISLPAVSINKMNSLRYLYLMDNDLNTLGNIMNSSRKELLIDLRNNRFACDWRLCWMVNVTSITFSYQSTPCTTPQSLTNMPWIDVTREILSCDKYEGLMAVSDLISPYELFVRRANNMFIVSPIRGYEAKVAREAVKIPIIFCSLECLKVGDTCLGFAFESIEGNCWLMIEF